MPDWTLTAGTTTKTLAAWGFKGDSLTLERISQAPDVCTVTKPGPMDATLLFAFGSIVKIQRPDGTIWFQGRATLPVRQGSGDNESVAYRFEGPWFDLDNIIFEQTWQQFNGYTTPGDPSTPPTFISKFASEVFLGFQADGTRINTGQQITQALTWAVGAGANLQIGTITPATNFAYYNVRDMTCGEVIRQMLRWTPDTITWFDYSTTPPTFYAKRLADLTATTVTLGTDKIKALSLRPRPDLVLDACVIRYKIPNSVNGIVFIAIQTDTYPVGATEQHIFNSINTIELFGFRKTVVSATIKTNTIFANAVASADRVTWWENKIPWLKDPHIVQSSIQITFNSAIETIIDPVTGASNDVAVDMTQYPNELIDGQIATWMTGFHQKEVKLSATLTYARTTDTSGAIPIQGANGVPITCTVKGTNATSGTYTAIQSFEEGDPVPSGLAQDIYTSRATLQHEGEIELVGSEIPAGFAMGQKISLNGLASSFGSMMVQQITEEPFAGRITLRVGPPRQIGIQDLIELMRANRYRIIYNLPIQQQGSPEASGNVPLGSNMPKQDSVADSTPSSAFGVSKDQGGGTTAVVVKDAIGPAANPGPQVRIVYYDSAGAKVTTQPSATMNVSDLVALGLVNHDAKFVLLKFKDPNNSCAPMKMAVMGTTPEPDV